VGLYNQATAQFFLRNEHAGGFADIEFSYGPRDPGNLIPLAGEWSATFAGVDEVSGVKDAPDPGQLVALNAPNPVSGRETTFMAHGVNAQRIAVQVYNISGQLVWQGEAPGAVLTWNTQDRAGRPLANGVYLYQVNALVDGQWVVAGIQRLLIVR